jgi:adenylate cyclase
VSNGGERRSSPTRPHREAHPLDTAELAAIATDHRVHRTFAFVDLCGFTDFVDDHGDEGAVQELQILRAAVREVTPLFGVRVEKWLGDGLMLVGVDSEPLVGAALAIEQRHSRAGRLDLRGGIASGAVILLEGDDYVGRAVNLASRLCDIAGPGQLLAATDDLDLPEWVTAAEHDPVVMKGMADEVAVVALSPDQAVLRRKSRTRSANALLAVVEGITRPMRTWSQAG